MNSDLKLALALADKADQIAMSRFRSIDLHVDTKPDFTPVTEADRAVETEIRNALTELLPNDGIIGEEFQNSNTDAARVWIIDPIDGTKNYVRGVPVWASLISLAIDGTPLIGVASAPAMGRRWWASPEDGAFTRDPDGSVRSISVSAVKEISDASFSFSDSVGWENFGNGQALSKIQTKTWRSRGYGDFWSHLLVAEGAVDVAVEPQLEPYDMAAFIAIVNAAGGNVTTRENGPALFGGHAVTTNGLLHNAVLSLIND